jgi:hypothetical protein
MLNINLSIPIESGINMFRLKAGKFSIDKNLTEELACDSKIPALVSITRYIIKFPTTGGRQTMQYAHK